VTHRPMEAWLIRRDAYPAYLSWDQFVANQARLANNASRFAQRS
jgi:hypothetical protein